MGWGGMRRSGRTSLKAPKNHGDHWPRACPLQDTAAQRHRGRGWRSCLNERTEQSLEILLQQNFLQLPQTEKLPQDATRSQALPHGPSGSHLLPHLLAAEHTSARSVNLENGAFGCQGAPDVAQELLRSGEGAGRESAPWFGCCARPRTPNCSRKLLRAGEGRQTQEIRPMEMQREEMEEIAHTFPAGKFRWDLTRVKGISPSLAPSCST